MARLVSEFPSHRSLTLLSRILLQPQPRDPSVTSPERIQLKRDLLGLRREEFNDLLMLARDHHVIVRGLEVVLSLMREEENATRTEWAGDALAAERARIATLLVFLREICAAFHERRYDVTVMKSLDHWPDLGSDLDLYTDADPEGVSRLMRETFDARIAPRSYGDRLANKWSFILPELPEEVEVHIGRLGQTGEQLAIASSMADRSRQLQFGGYRFQVPSTSDRVMISTLQRMYRHFNFRLCDIIDTAALADAGAIDYENLRSLAGAAGIWEGAATYLRIVSDYAMSYRGTGLDLPQFVTAAAKFGGDEIFYNRGYLRVPLMPQSARLYGLQLARVLGRGELHSGARLSLLPWLAIAAAAKYRFTGSDKGVW